MVNYWTNFAKTGNPNGPGLPIWPAWSSKGDGQLMRFNATSKAEPEQHRAAYELQDLAARSKRGK